MGFLSTLKQKHTEHRIRSDEKKAQSKGFSSYAEFNKQRAMAREQGFKQARATARKNELKQIRREAREEFGSKPSKNNMQRGLKIASMFINGPAPQRQSKRRAGTTSRGSSNPFGDPFDFGMGATKKRKRQSKNKYVIVRGRAYKVGGKRRKRKTSKTRGGPFGDFGF